MSENENISFKSEQYKLVLSRSKMISNNKYAYPFGNKYGIFDFIKKRIVEFDGGEVCGVFDLKSLALSASGDANKISKDIKIHLNKISNKNTILFVSLGDESISGENYIILSYPISIENEAAISELIQECIL